jgi:hypothetical protein
MINKEQYIVPLLEKSAEYMFIYVNVGNHAPHGCCWRFKTAASLRVTWCLFTKDGPP